MIQGQRGVRLQASEGPLWERGQPVVLPSAEKRVRILIWEQEIKPKELNTGKEKIV